MLSFASQGGGSARCNVASPKKVVPQLVRNVFSRIFCFAIVSCFESVFRMLDFQLEHASYEDTVAKRQLQHTSRKTTNKLNGGKA